MANKRPYTNGATKMIKLPRWADQGFLEKLDGRYQITKAIRECYGEVIEDLGGEDNISGAKRALVERFSFCKFLLIDLEQKILTTKKTTKRNAMIDRWGKLNQTLKNLAVAVGLERRRKPAKPLKVYVNEQKNG